MKKQKKDSFSDIRQKTEEEMAKLQPPPAPPEEELRYNRRNAVKDPYSPMVREVLAELRDALAHPYADIKEGINAEDGAGFWTLKDNYSAQVMGTTAGNIQAYAEVILVFDKEDRPLHFVCTRFRTIFDKRSLTLCMTCLPNSQLPAADWKSCKRGHYGH